MLTLFRLPKSYNKMSQHPIRVIGNTYRQDQVLHGQFNFDPFIVTESGPNEVGLSDRRLVWVQDNLGLLVVNVERAQEKDDTRERSVA